MKKYIFLVIFFFALLNLSFFELEVKIDESGISSFIGLTIDGIASTTFPTKESNKAIDSILCDKGASGVWDYENWTLKVRNITESRTKCQINFVSKYYESILNGTDPVLKDGLIPVIIENDGVVKKASLGWKWYEYQNQEWANAVILNDENEVYYDGQVIPEIAIESYFVWIPRYQYKIWNMGNYSALSSVDNNQVHTIDIKFGLETTSDTETTCATPLVSGESGTCSIGKYMTHPAFIAFETNGFWVGKFETGYKDATSASLAQHNENNPDRVQIKPDVYSWRGIQIANSYLTSYDYKREYDSHMMKNTEWGAVAYLQHSQYGSQESVRINNNSDYKTGYAGTNEPTTGFTGTSISCTTTHKACNEYGTASSITKLWNNNTGFLASTTGNITGVYDMSGGAHEFVMGVMLSSDNQTPCSGRDATYNSGFNGRYCNTANLSKTDGIPFPPDTRYYDLYVYTTNDVFYNRRILGDATGEMGPFSSKIYGTQPAQIGSWYTDEGLFVTSNYSWFTRGSHWTRGFNTGVFAFHHSSGPVDTYSSFRVVLAIK